MVRTELNLVEKVVEYGIAAWKLSIPCIDDDDEEEDDEEDDDEEDEDGDEDRQRTACNDGEIANVFPIDENPEHNVEITWFCVVDRTNIVLSGGNKENECTGDRGENQLYGSGHERILQNQHH